MIDKTIPYCNIIMRYDGPVMEEIPLPPQGYQFRGYVPGDENAWAYMEVANNDFDTYDNAVNYFRNKYCSEPEKLRERFIGIEDADHILRGSVICWDDQRNGREVSSVHWLISDPNVQGCGIGTALVKMLIYKFSERRALPIYLHTQPWSYRAIGIYSKEGFRILRKDSFREYDNHCDQAITILKTYMKEQNYLKLVNEMI